MSEHSRIEWTDATWNPVRGCSKVSPGCTHCYAETFAERFRGIPGHPFEKGFDLRLVPEKLMEPLRWSQPKMIFVNSMSDLFQDEVPLDAETLKKDFTPENQPRLVKLRDAFSSLNSFDAATLGNTLTSLAAEMGVKAGVLVHPTRLACTGKTIGPSLYHLMEVLGKERVLHRLDRALEMSCG